MKSTPTWIALALLALALLQKPAAAQNPDGFQWSSIQFTDEAERGVTASLLRYSVPETDNVLVEGYCNARSSATSVAVKFSADFGNAANGDFVQVRFLGEGFNNIYPAVVDHPQDGEGVYGIRVDIAFEDPLWSALKRLSSIAYSVNGGQFVTLGLSGSSKAINRFLDECMFYGGQGGGLVPGTQSSQPLGTGQPSQPFDPRWASCEALGNNRSQRSDVPVTMTFVNRSDGYRSVMWIGFDGQPVNYANLNPGEQFSVSTFLTHPWMFTDGPGNCIEMVMPQQGVNVFNITAPGRNFGPE
ncbi:MAG: hypothetical protein KDJ51_03150 [Nitratireductor sp.]|nr:hypothetical protein [Nitratireductor sp.]